MVARRGGRGLPAAASAARAARRDAGDGAHALQARTRAAHGAPLPRGERRVSAGVRALGTARAARRGGDTPPRSLAPPEPARRAALLQPAGHHAADGALRPPGRTVAGGDHRAVARGALGDRRRRTALRLHAPRRPHLVGWNAAHGTRRGLRRQAQPRPRATGRLRLHALRARERAGLLPRPQRRSRCRRRTRARRPDGRVPAGCPGALLPQHGQPPRCRAATATRDRAARRRLDVPGDDRCQRRLRPGRAL